MSIKNKSVGPRPITSRIQKSTRGGMVTQPLLNMGAPVSMRSTPPASPNKQVGALVRQGVKQVVKQVAKRNMPAVKTYAAEIVKKGTKQIAKSKPVIQDAVYSTVKKGGSKWWNVGKKILKATALGVGINAFMKSDTSGVVNKPKDETKKKTTPKKSKSYDQAYKDRDQKVYGADMDKDTYIKEAKRQKAVHAKTGKWDVKDSYKKKEAKVDKVISKKADPKTKVTKTKVTKTKVETAKPKVEVAAKQPSSYNKFKAKKLATDGARKTRKAVDKQAQADEATANGNHGKARRKQRAADRKSRKANKKFSQASAAITPGKN
jgi:hypothetical protein